MEKMLYGAAYYDEYMPYERLDKDIAMMKAAGMNVVRIGESTWSTCEPQDGAFDFSHVTRVIEAMGRAGISVIIGTPTYAIPAWLAKAHPEVMVETAGGRAIYGARQQMDITDPTYRFYAERVIRRMMEECAGYENVIGVQIDNETKSYDTSGPGVQKAFVEYIKERFNGDLDALNAAWGLDYWSNRINTWEDFPDVRGSINNSMTLAFKQFQKKLAADFLLWQRDIVKPYLREDQFITHNMDYNWAGASNGANPKTDVYEAAKAMDIVGTDIYHPSQEHLTGMEIAFGGDMSRSLKQDNYLVLETQAQGFPAWMPYPGQLRLAAYSHAACGANMVEYWHWHTLHNACETYWRGVLSQDFKENETYKACCQVGAEWERIGDRIVNLKKENKVAVLLSSRAQSALDWFADMGVAQQDFRYNDVLMPIYRQLYNMNLECDLIWEQNAAERMSAYDLVIIPALYAAGQDLLDAIAGYVEAGGHILGTFKTAFSDQDAKVWPDEAPHTLAEVFGISYSHITIPENVELRSHTFETGRRHAEHFMELLKLQGARALISYKHHAWGGYAAVTRNSYGSGTATYIGCGLPDDLLAQVLSDTAEDAGLKLPGVQFPVIIRRGTNALGEELTYIFNYSWGEKFYTAERPATELLTGCRICSGDRIPIDDWSLAILVSE